MVRLRLMRACSALPISYYMLFSWPASSPGASHLLLRAASLRSSVRMVDTLISSCPACIMQLACGANQQKLPVSVLEIVELLDEAYRNAENGD